MRSWLKSYAARTPNTAATANTPATTTVRIALPSPPAIDSRARIAVDQRNGGVHQQHGERETLRVAAPRSQHVSKEPDPRAVDEATAHRRCGRYGIGGDEEGAKHAGTAEQMKPGRRVVRGV